MDEKPGIATIHEMWGVRSSDADDSLSELN